MVVLVTGVAGFIGSHVARALLDRGEEVVGIDNFSSYYDPGLKSARLDLLRGRKGFTFLEADISDRTILEVLAPRFSNIGQIVHLAAQPGVLHSITDPHVYVQTNVVGHLVMLEVARNCRTLQHFVYASSSSVYGGNLKFPFSIADRVDNPVSLYAATKRADELMTEAYTYQFAFKATGLRYFTVYGPWGRPDMSPYIFTKSIFEGRPIVLAHMGKIRRDYTYVDDIVSGTLAVLDRPPDVARHRVYNLGASKCEDILHVVSLFEKVIGRKAEIGLKPAIPGDMAETAADIESTTRDFGWAPQTSVEDGIPRFVEWYRAYHRV